MINQERDWTGCGIATFGNACGMDSFSDAKQWMDDKGLCNSNEFVTVPQMRSALEMFLGKTVSLKYSAKGLGKHAVLFVEYQKGSSDRHWVYYKNGLYFDPLPENRNLTSSIPYKVTRILSIHD